MSRQILFASLALVAVAGIAPAQSNSPSGGDRVGRDAGRATGRLGRAQTARTAGNNNRFSFGAIPAWKASQLPNTVLAFVPSQSVGTVSANSLGLALTIGGFRLGYYHYDAQWRDSNFCYPFYAFNPFGTQVVVSPWYYYPTLPAYLPGNRIFVVGAPPIWGLGWQGTPYPLRSQRRSLDRADAFEVPRRGRDEERLDDALDDIVAVFERGSRRALNRLVPARGRAAIYLDGRYRYSLDVDDFHDLLIDAAENTRTSRYLLSSVRLGPDEARVVAEHDHVDPWGRTTRVEHVYRLALERGEWVIRDFGTSTPRR